MFKSIAFTFSYTRQFVTSNRLGPAGLFYLPRCNSIQHNAWASILGAGVPGQAAHRSGTYLGDRVRASGNRRGAKLAEGAYPHEVRCPRVKGLPRFLTRRTGAGFRNAVERTSPGCERDDWTGAASLYGLHNGATENHTLYLTRAERSPPTIFRARIPHSGPRWRRA